MKDNEITKIAQRIVRGNYINFGKNEFFSTSGIYKVTNENISAYFNHLKNKKNVLSVIGSGDQIINSILAGTKNIDAFDISLFPEYYLYLKIATIVSLSKDDYLTYYFSDSREDLFSYEIYEKIRNNLKGKYKMFWDSLYDFNEGYEIYNSLLFRSDFFNKEITIENNLYLQDNNYEKVKKILKFDNINISTKVFDITKTKIDKEYDLINLSNILFYYFDSNKIKEYINFLDNFKLFNNGEIINYIFSLDKKIEKEFYLYSKKIIIEDLVNTKLLVYKNN